MFDTILECLLLIRSLSVYLETFSFTFIYSLSILNLNSLSILKLIF